MSRKLSPEEAMKLLKIWGYFEKPDGNIPKEDLDLLEKTFKAIEFREYNKVPEGIEIIEEKVELPDREIYKYPSMVKLPNGRVYKCLPVGWKRVR